MLGVGGAILATTGRCGGWWSRGRSRRPGAGPGAAPRLARAPLALAWTQILLDLGCLTLLVLWTGGTHSARLGFTVFHMVFASLLAGA